MFVGKYGNVLLQVIVGINNSLVKSVSVEQWKFFSNWYHTFHDTLVTGVTLKKISVYLLFIASSIFIIGCNREIPVYGLIYGLIYSLVFWYHRWNYVTPYPYLSRFLKRCGPVNHRLFAISQRLRTYEWMFDEHEMQNSGLVPNICREVLAKIRDIARVFPAK